MKRLEYDAIVVGAGPNGLAAAITLQRAGLSVLVLEGEDKIGGGMRTEELTLPGFKHDVCSAIHPMAVHSPFMLSLPLQQFGLQYIYPTIALAHPFDNGRAVAVAASIQETAKALGADEAAYLNLINPVVRNWDRIVDNILGPLRLRRYPLELASFGWNALKPASVVAGRFHTMEAKALWAGMAAHAIQPLENCATSAIGMVLAAAAHNRGWPLPKGGSQAIANAMLGYFKLMGGVVETGRFIQSIDELPPAKAVLLDITPRQLLRIAGHRFSGFYKRQLENYRYGMGAFKIDWALSEPIPFTSELCRQAATVHIGGTYEEIAASEYQSANGNYVERPFVLLAQQSLFDSSRAPDNEHTAWAYCHVPNGAAKDMTAEIENQVERFAPGFKDIILKRHVISAKDYESYNPNYIGGDINGGIIDIRQLYTRPALRWSPYRTSAKGIYICSSSTPPGGGVHGMCGYHAARTALKDLV